jgi:hypothetical protein
MTTNNPHVSLTLPLLQYGEISRLQKAVTALADGTLTYYPHQTDRERITGIGEEW